MKKESARIIDYDELANLSIIGGNDYAPNVASTGNPTTRICSVVATVTVSTIIVSSLLSRGTCRN